MSESAISVLIWLHVVGVAIWLGGQIVTAAAVIPALRSIGERAHWIDALEAFTSRFGRIGIVAMIVIVVTGGAMVDPRLDMARDFGENIGDARWGVIFIVKMSLWLAMIVVIGLHQFVFGPRQLALARAAIAAHGEGDEAALARVRRLTIALSMIGLLLTLAVAAAGAALGNHGYSMAPS